MRILITGAAGFIGSNLANHYAKKKYEVFGIDNYESAGKFRVDPRVTMIQGDIRRSGIRQQIKNIQPDIISHHAARIDPRISMENPIADIETNLMGTVNVAQAAKNCGCERVIFASSCAVYGNVSVRNSMIEGQFELPTCPYGVSKLASEKMLKIFSDNCGISTTALRYPNIYGPGQNGQRSTGVIAIFAYQMMNGLPITIYGDGSATYQYLFIDDLLRAHDSAIALFDDRKPSTFVVSNLIGFPASVLEIIEVMKNHFPKWKAGIKIANVRRGEQRHISMIGNTAEALLRWTPSIDLRSGIAKVVAYAKKAGHARKP